MSELEGLMKVPYNKAYVFVISVLLNILPVFLFIFEFENKLFTNTDLIKLMLLSASISIPGFVLVHALSLIKQQNKATDEPGGYSEKKVWIPSLVIASLATASAYYTPCALLFFFKLTTYWAIWIVIAIHLLFLFLLVPPLKKK